MDLFSPLVVIKWVWFKKINWIFSFVRLFPLLTNGHVMLDKGWLFYIFKKKKTQSKIRLHSIIKLITSMGKSSLFTANALSKMKLFFFLIPRNWPFYSNTNFTHKIIQNYHTLPDIDNFIIERNNKINDLNVVVKCKHSSISISNQWKTL